MKKLEKILNKKYKINREVSNRIERFGNIETAIEETTIELDIHEEFYEKYPSIHLNNAVSALKYVLASLKNLQNNGYKHNI